MVVLGPIERSWDRVFPKGGCDFCAVTGNLMDPEEDSRRYFLHTWLRNPSLFQIFG